jgi:hypothetical protein
VFCSSFNRAGFFDSGKRRLVSPISRRQKVLKKFSLIILRSIVNRVKIAYRPEITKKWVVK